MRTVVLTVPECDGELAADRLWSAGARAVEERDRGAVVELRTVLADDDATSLDRLGRLPGDWAVSFVDVDDVPADTWRDHVAPTAISDRLVLRPAWLPPHPQPGVLELAIGPGAAFGLGDHPTTRLAAALVDDHVRSGDRVLDVGCGSGVLAILAISRGAASAMAIDVADAAREATLANAERNGVAGAISASTTPLERITGRFDLVIANILASTLVAMADDLRRVTAGALIVSGVLADRHEHVVAALEPMAVVERRTLDGWAGLLLR